MNLLFSNTIILNKITHLSWKKLTFVLDTASNVYNNLLKIYSEQFNKFKPNKNKKTAFKNRPKSFSLKEHYNFEG